VQFNTLKQERLELQFAEIQEYFMIVSAGSIGWTGDRRDAEVSL
jgi:hypothetical protein